MGANRHYPLDSDTTTTRSFEASNKHAVRDFIDRYNRDQNIYFTGNLCDRPNKKPSKADMTGAAFLHTDDDPREGETPELAKQRDFCHLHGTRAAAFDHHRQRQRTCKASGCSTSVLRDPEGWRAG